MNKTTDSETDKQQFRDTARSAGLKQAVPTLVDIEHRRSELLGLTFVMLIAFAAALVLLSVSQTTTVFGQFTISANVIRASVLALAFIYSAYLFQSERRLRSISSKLVTDLINERAVSSALQNRLTETERFNRAIKALATLRDLEEGLDIILAAAAETLSAEDASVLLLDGDDLIVRAGHGASAEHVGFRQTMGDGVAGYVARSNQSVVIEGEVEMAEFAALLGSTRGSDRRIASSICVPFEVDRALAGVACFNVRTGTKRYDEYDLRTAELFAGHLGLAVQQTRPRIAVPLKSGVEMKIATMERSLEPRPVGSPLSVLVADDDPGLLRMLELHFEQRGHGVILASDGKTALDLVASRKPDVLLLDIALPLVDGWRVLEALRDSDSRPYVICISGRKGRRDQLKAWTLGVDEYIAKPFDAQELVESVEEVVAREPNQQADRKASALRDLYADN